MQAITSEHNPRIKHLVKLQQRKYREKHQEMIVEGLRLVEETMEVGCLKELFFDEAVVTDVRAQKILAIAEDKQLAVWSVPNKLLRRVTDTETPSGVLGLSTIPPWQNLTTDMPADAFVLLADKIQDPGNLGTMIRTAAAAGAEAVLIGRGCVDPWNSKVVRSSMGAVFRVPLVYGTREYLLDELAQKDFDIAAADIRGAVPYYRASLNRRIALAIGSEADGLHRSIIDRADVCVLLPMQQGIESLNASAAAAILLYECRRQRDCRCQPSLPVL